MISISFFKRKKYFITLKYIPGLAKIAYRGQLHSTETKRKHADDSYKNKKVIEFNVLLTASHYTKSTADKDKDITASTIPVNKFFAHGIKEIDIKRYGDDMPILPLINTVDIYRYSDELIPKDALKTIQNDLFYSKEKVVI